MLTECLFSQDTLVYKLLIIDSQVSSSGHTLPENGSPERHNVSVASILLLLMQRKVSESSKVGHVTTFDTFLRKQSLS
jgi:hypothetical protein